MIMWADVITRQRVLDAVMDKLSIQDLIDVRHVLDRNAVRRSMIMLTGRLVSSSGTRN